MSESATRAAAWLPQRLMAPLLVAAVIALAPLAFSSGYHFRIGALVSINALAVIGLNILMGLAGQVSLGHAAFFGIGAYAVAILPAQFGIDPIVSAIVGAFVCAAVAIATGRTILRLKGHYLAVATLGLGMLVAMVLNNELWLTGGPDGMAAARPEIGGWRARSSEAWYWISGACLVIGIVLAENLRASSVGLALGALHDSEVAASVLGVDVARAKLAAFVVSAVYGSVAGSLLGFLNGRVTPDRAGFLQSIEFATMAVLGGLGSMVGSVVGAAVLVVLPQVLTLFHEYEHLMLGLLIIVIMIVLPSGVVPTLLDRIARRPGK
ncbi:MAG: branched-chain amino acid ABC transporter permease [Hyphomicrobiaceae bacterium]|nr:MAG: branched-chain amino acid ABC transporter permease [Hyphomicrobiaceae bacterium]